MLVTSKAYKIWKRLFNEPNVWLSIPSVAYDVDMSSRQVQAVLKTMNSPYIEKQPGSPDSVPAIRLTISQEDFVKLKRDVIMSYNKLSEEMLDEIYNVLSPVGWTSAADLSLETGYCSAKICIALSIMDGVIQKNDGVSKLYSLT